VSTLRAVASVLWPGTPCEPRVCSACGRTRRRLTGRERALLGSRILPRCRRRRCGGLMWPASSRLARISRRRTVAHVIGQAARTFAARDEDGCGAPEAPGTPPIDTTSREDSRP
jgi:hypothetical protein